MWDSRVACTTGRTISYQAKSRDVLIYPEYVRWIRRASISSTESKRWRQYLGSAATELRVKEFLLFQLRVQSA